MSTAYGGTPLGSIDATDKQVDGANFPWHSHIVGIGSVSLDVVKKGAQVDYLHWLLNREIEDGNSYPQEFPLNEEQFRAYFLSHYAFSLCSEKDGSVLGAFYIKPNFPGRASHICNGGYSKLCLTRFICLDL